MRTLEDQLRAYGRELEQLSAVYSLRTSFFVDGDVEVIDPMPPDARRPWIRRILFGVSALGIGAASVFGLAHVGQQAAAGPRFAEVVRTTPDTHYVLGYLPPGFSEFRVDESVSVAAGRAVVVGQVKSGRVTKSILAMVNSNDNKGQKGYSENFFTTENVGGQIVRTRRNTFDGVELVMFQVPALKGCDPTFSGFGQSFEESLRSAEQFSCVDGSLVVRPTDGNELLYDGADATLTDPSLVVSRGASGTVTLLAGRTSLPNPILESMTYASASTVWTLGHRSIHTWERSDSMSTQTWFESFTWQEADDITLTLGFENPIPRDEVAKMIESVRRVEPAEWAALT
jgi:hypothetical protein